MGWTRRCQLVEAETELDQDSRNADWIIQGGSWGMCTADRHKSFSSNIQTASADVARWMWTSPRGAVENKLHKMRIEYGAPMAESYAGACKWCEADECISAIEGLKGKKRGCEQGR